MEFALLDRRSVKLCQRFVEGRISGVFCRKVFPLALALPLPLSNLRHGLLKRDCFWFMTA